MHPSCLVPIVQASGGWCYDLGMLPSVMSSFSEVMLPKMRSADDLNILNDQVFCISGCFLP